MCKEQGSFFCSRTMDRVSVALILRSYFLFVNNFTLIWPVTECSAIACGRVRLERMLHSLLAVIKCAALGYTRVDGKTMQLMNTGSKQPNKKKGWL